MITKIQLAAASVLAVLLPHPAQAQSLSPSDQTMVYGICIALFLIFVAIGGYLIWRSLQERALAKACLNWPTAGGKVQASDVEVRKHYSRKKRRTTYTYCPNIRYAYEAGGVRRESASIRFGLNDTGRKRWAERLVGKYPAGSTVAVKYNPADPSVAVIETEWSSQKFWQGLIFIFFGTLVPLAVLFIFLAAGADGSFGGVSGQPQEQRQPEAQF